MPSINLLEGALASKEDASAGEEAMVVGNGEVDGCGDLSSDKGVAMGHSANQKTSEGENSCKSLDHDETGDWDTGQVRSGRTYTPGPKSCCPEWVATS